MIYEELERAFDVQDALELPEPELVTLSSLEMANLEARAPELEAWGLRLEPFGGNLYRVRSLPAVVMGLPMQNIVYDVVSHALGASDAKTSVLSRLACHPAVKAGHRLGRADAEELIESLRACTVPWSCPHGRPTALRWTERDLAHQFGRRSARDIPREGDEVRSER